MNTRQIENLLAWKQENGNFRTLDDVKSVRGIGRQAIDKFRVSDESSESVELADRKRLPKLSIKPQFKLLSSKTETPPTSFAIINTHPAICSWTVFQPLHGSWNTGIDVVDWQAKSLVNDPKIILTDLVNDLTNAVNAIPECDHYIFSEHSHTSSMSLGIRYAQIDTCLVTLLNQRATEPPTIYFSKMLAMSQLFGLFFNGELKASKDAVCNVLEAEKCENGVHECHVQDIPYDVRIEEDFCTRYYESSEREREFLGKALLQGITVYMLCRKKWW